MNLQRRLSELNYSIIGSDGYYDYGTMEAVMKFQEKNGLETTGIADNETQALLFSSNAEANIGLPLEGCVIGIDPGHQAKSNTALEPISPGSSKTKKKVSSNSIGVYSGTPDCEINLSVALLLRDMLEEQGATVVLTRTTNNVDISNIERAEVFNSYNTDFAIRLFCNSSDNKDKSGALAIIPSSHAYQTDIERAARVIMNEYCSETGANHLSTDRRSDQTCFNWCDNVIMSVELGYLSNTVEDINLNDTQYQNRMARGLCNGIIKYFEG